MHVLNLCHQQECCRLSPWKASSVSTHAQNYLPSLTLKAMLCQTKLVMCLPNSIIIKKNRNRNPSLNSSTAETHTHIYVYLYIHIYTYICTYIYICIYKASYLTARSHQHLPPESCPGRRMEGKRGSSPSASSKGPLAFMQVGIVSSDQTLPN